MPGVFAVPHGLPDLLHLSDHAGELVDPAVGVGDLLLQRGLVDEELLRLLPHPGREPVARERLVHEVAAAHGATV